MLRALRLLQEARRRGADKSQNLASARHETAHQLPSGIVVAQRLSTNAMTKIKARTFCNGAHLFRKAQSWSDFQDRNRTKKDSNLRLTEC